jgi:hypothetical protein
MSRQPSQSEVEKKVTFAFDPTDVVNDILDLEPSARFPQVNEEPMSLKKPKKVVKLPDEKAQEIKQKVQSFSELVQNETSLANAISNKVD